MLNRSLLLTAFTVLLALSILTAGPTSAAPPPYEVGDNITAYRLALARSTDPQAQAIRDEIANGPVDLARAKAAALKDGILLTSKVAMPPQDQNAAPLYEQWETMLRKWYWKLDDKNIHYPLYVYWLTLRYQYTPKEMAAVQKFVDDNRVPDVLLMKAIKKPALYSSRDPLDPSDLDSTLREASYQVQAEAILLALKGQFRDAVAMQVNGFAIQRQAEQEPSVINDLNAISIEVVTIVGLQDILGHSKPDAYIGEMVGRAILAAKDHQSIKRALQGDPVWLFRMFDSIEKQMVTGSKTDASKNTHTAADRLFYVQLLDAVEARDLNDLRAAVEVADEPPMKRRLALARQAKTADALYGHITNDPVDAILLGPKGYVHLTNQDDVRAAREQVTLAAAAALSVKAKTGRFPSALPGRFMDPFSGKPLVYRREGQGFVVYSIGPTGHFDGHYTNSHTGSESAFHYPTQPPVPVPKDLL